MFPENHVLAEIFDLKEIHVLKETSVSKPARFELIYLQLV